MGWLRRMIGGRSRAEALALAHQEKMARAARDITRSCAHPCHSCDYFELVYELTYADFMRVDSASLKAEHVEACNTGTPNAGSCPEQGCPTSFTKDI